jgi:tRNA threonylcarbamoyladenosine biosynthesis protein TsaE
MELPEVAKKILHTYPKERIFGFYGEMGAGKTTLIKEICKVLGVKNITSSPSFAIVNEYTSANNEPVYHFDFYRIEKLDDAYQIVLKII